MGLMFLCIDLGATSGRHIIGKVENGEVSLEVTFRFKNHFIDDYYWDVNYLYQKIIEGIDTTLAKGYRPVSLSIDAWGVDYVEGDSDRALSYRAPKEKKNIDEVDKVFSPRELFEMTGISPQDINTIYRIDNRTQDILFVRDHFVYLLTGEKYSDTTILSTSQIFDVRKMTLSEKIISKIAPNMILPPIVKPGEVYIQAREYEIEVLVGAGHDTANCFYLFEKEENTAILNIGTWTILGTNIDSPIINEESYNHGFSNEVGVNKIRFLKNMLGMYAFELFLKQEGINASYTEIIDKMIENNHEETISLNRIDLEERLLDVLASKFPRKNNDWYLVLIINSLVYEYSLNIDLVSRLTKLPIKKLVVMGGATKNSVFMKKLQRTLAGTEIVRGNDEATALGNIQLQYDSWIRRGYAFIEHEK